MLAALLPWVEATAFSTWLRESESLLAFPLVLILHTLGLVLLVGTNAVINLRLLGVAPGIPLETFETFFPLMTWGFWINAVSGIVLLAAYPTKAVTNPVFWVKLTFVAISLLLLRSIKRQISRGPSSTGTEASLFRRPAFLAGASLACWMVAIAAGRLLAYTYRHLMWGLGALG